MASPPGSSQLRILALLTAASLLSAAGTADAQLSPAFYEQSCPALEDIVRSTMVDALQSESRLGASVLRLFFHDCMVQGADASVLLDDTPTFTGEKTASSNRQSLRGFDVIDAIKSVVEDQCPETVSCADILALAARDAVFLLGGPTWPVQLGRRDATTASLASANSDLPGPGSDLRTLISKFAAKGLSPRDMTALSGAHSIGFAQCKNFRARLYNDSNIDPRFAAFRQLGCPASGGGDSELSPLDVQTPLVFGSEYYDNLVQQQGLLHSDQELFNGGSQDALVQHYSENPDHFRADFTVAMMRMGRIGVLTGGQGEIRVNCRAAN